MTDGMAARPATTKSRTSSQIFLHIHPTKEIRRGEGDEKHALSFLWMTGPEYVGNTGIYETNGSYVGCVITRPGSV